MSHVAQAGNRHKSSGRVTPKLRRTAFVAADGALAVGMAALGGLFAVGSASGAAPTPGWSGTQAPTVTGPDAPGGNPETNLVSTSCVSAAFCAADGSYQDSGSHERGLLEAMTNGSWSAQEAPLPANADPANPNAQFKDVSCATAGWCVASGYYFDPSGGIYTSFDTLSGGGWSATEAPVPADAAGGSSAEVVPTTVSCPAPGICTAVGEYHTASGHTAGLIETLSGGTWSEQVAPQPSGAAAMQQAALSALSCPSTSFCVAGGNYRTSNNGFQPDVLDEVNGSWTAQDAPLPSDSGTLTNLNAGFSSISCPTAGTCEGVGDYRTASSGQAGLLERLSGGSWVASEAPEPADAATGSSQNALFRQVSCTFDGGCVAVGDYGLMAGDSNHALVDSIVNGVATAVSVPVPADVGATPTDSLNSVSCLDVNECAAVGTYNTASSPTSVGLIEQETNGTWNSLAAALPPNAATGSTAASFLTAVSCTSRWACNAVGDYSDPNTFGVQIAYTPPEGYWEVASDGGIFAWPNATFHGSRGGQPINAPMVGMAETPGSGGYWEVGADGGIYSYGNAPFYGSTGALRLNKPIVGIAATPDGGGYWLVAADGGIFNYGDAGFYGSTGAIRLNKPIVGMAATPDGHGYWLVASDGGIFNYGDAGFYGSTGAIQLNKPVVGMASDGTGLGYWLVASDGGIFTYGDGQFLGSRGGQPLNKPIVGMMSSFDGVGYWLVASDGGIFSYGDTGFQGSTGGIRLNAPVVDGTPT
jgi:hypothetical protein